MRSYALVWAVFEGFLQKSLLVRCISQLKSANQRIPLLSITNQLVEEISTGPHTLSPCPVQPSFEPQPLLWPLLKNSRWEQR